LCQKVYPADIALTFPVAKTGKRCKDHVVFDRVHLGSEFDVLVGRVVETGNIAASFTVAERRMAVMADRTVIA
jgi:hypothetical protein